MTHMNFHGVQKFLIWGILKINISIPLCWILIWKQILKIDQPHRGLSCHNLLLCKKHMHTETTLRLLLSFLHFLYPQVNNKTQITGKFLEQQKKKNQKRKLASCLIVSGSFHRKCYKLHMWLCKHGISAHWKLSPKEKNGFILCSTLLWMFNMVIFFFFFIIIKSTMVKSLGSKVKARNEKGKRRKKS